MFLSRSHSRIKTSAKSILNHNQSTKLTKKEKAPYALNETHPTWTIFAKNGWKHNTQ